MGYVWDRDSEESRHWLKRLLANDSFRKHLTQELGERGDTVIASIERDELIEADDSDALSDVADEVFRQAARTVLTLGWDGDFPGASGAIWIEAVEDVFLVVHPDVDTYGPFENIEEAVKEEHFHIPTSNPELHSDELPTEILMSIARDVVEWDNDGEVWINKSLYASIGNELVRIDPDVEAGH